MIESVESAGLLTSGEREELAGCEAVIERGRLIFEEVGNALLRIRDARLYRVSHATFADYCALRWEMGRRRAYQLMEAAEVAANVNPGSQVPLTSERQARELALLEPDDQRAAWAEVIETAKAGGITAAQIRLSVERRIAVKVGRSGEQQTPLLPAAGKFSLILADPPWQYDFSNFSGRVVENHYPTMALEAICALPVEKVAAADCVLFLWATSPKLPEALEVVKAWGFTYRTNSVWEKNGLELGYYFRQNHELILVAARGQPGVPAATDRTGSVIHADKRRHSEKPEVVYAVIERMYPHARRLELFARTERSGWTSWGNEVPEGAAEAPGTDRGERYGMSQ